MYYRQGKQEDGALLFIILRNRSCKVFLGVSVNVDMTEQ